GDHSSRPAVAARLEHPTRPHSAGSAVAGTAVPAGDCLGLHAVGLAVPRPSPAARRALTAPFHPYPRRREIPATPPVSCLWRCPAPIRHQTGGWALPTTVPCRVRTFLQLIEFHQRSPHSHRRHYSTAVARLASELART